DTGAAAPVAQALLAPVLRTPGVLRVPPDAAGRRAWVDLDVHVTETGEVDVVRRSGGSSDRALIDAAIACARGMRFFPAERAGVPVAVWCTQRFEFGAPR
ncbi:MAG TPA: TonB family protein, partial [Gemmatimonadales bacterium]|nr:TonB family protein [Gemmatimonadales bacterium]